MDTPRKLRDEDLACLEGNRWLNDEVIFAFFTVVSNGTQFSPLDPCLIQTPLDYRIRAYPLVDAELLFPFNMNGGTHWSLAWMRPSHNCIVLYDSKAHSYSYSSQLLDAQEIHTLECTWWKVTDRALNDIFIAGEGYVHVQEDGFNCGVFACLYAERLCKGEPTVQEHATYAFLQNYRGYIKHLIASPDQMHQIFINDDCALDFNANICATHEVDENLDILPTNMNEQDLSCLEGNGWLYEEVICSFIRVVSHGTRFSLLHPCMIQTADTFRIPSYPLQNAELLFPLNMYNGTHWSLAWLRIFHKSIVLYDTKAHVYSYSPRLLPTQEKNLLESTWRKVTNRQLNVIIVTSPGGVHIQEDGFNCGVFVCMYAERLCNEEPTVQEDVSEQFLQNYRMFIRHVITMQPSFDEAVNGSREGQHYSDTGASFNRNHSATGPLPSSSEKYMEGDLNLCSGNVKNAPRSCHSTKLSRKLPRMELTASSHVSLKHAIPAVLSPCLLTQFLRIKYCEYNCLTFTSLGCDGCLKEAVGENVEQSYSSLIVLYFNRTKHIGLAVVRKAKPVSHATVFDYTTQRITQDLRTRIKGVARDCGFKDVAVKKGVISNHKVTVGVEVEATAICSAIEKFIRDGCITEIGVPLGDEVKALLNEIETTLYITLSISSTPKMLRSKTFPSTTYPEFYTIGEMDKLCPACGAMLFPGERSICCSNGQVVVPENVCSTQRDPLLEWFWNDVLQDEQLFYMIRPINNLVACAGVCMNLKSFEGTPGQKPLVLQGRFDIGLCHLNPDSEKACFAQLFIADDYKVQRSVQDTIKLWGTKVQYGLIQRIIDVLRKHNAIVQCYMTMYEVYLEEMKKIGFENTDRVPRVIMNLKQKRDIPRRIASDVHPARLNLPVFENQIAAIYVSKDGRMLSHEELDEGLKIFSRGGKTIAPHQSYNIDALTYPLLFPRGEQTFVKDVLPKRRAISAKRKEDDIVCSDISEKCDCDDVDDDDMEQKISKKQRFISRREFALYIMARRGDVQKHRILGTGKLYAQYVLHTFARIEADRLCSIGLHRTEVRSSTASSLFKYLDQKLNEKGVKLGKLVNMPKSYVGSRNWCQKLYSDAMAVAQRLGKPDLFITFTGNQDWPEIKNNLVGKFDSWITDPFLCCRVFFLRFSEFLDDIKKKEFFGKVTALHGSIEFQKRGMPHAHLLVTLADKIDTPEKIDSIISAEIPEYPAANDPQREEKLRLYKLVSKHMIHGPCTERANLACREADANKCSKGYPKSYRNVTEICNGGYPLYRRRDNGRIVCVGKLGRTFASNRDVVPTNYRLLMKHECHINVEVCSAIQAFKYIFKYVFKGPDAVVVELLENDPLMEKRVYSNERQERLIDVDMREVYRLARYVSHIEAAYRILGYPMHYATHSVISLRPHMPNEQPVFFKGNPSRRTKTSKLLAYFNLASHDDNVRDMTWTDVAENYRFVENKYVLYKHKLPRIARLWSVNPKMHELYAVRKLLLYKKGVRSFEDLRTHNGRLYGTFMEAAQAAGYIEKSSEWEECLRCACITEMPSQIRKVFAHILLYCKPCNTLELWHKFKAEMRRPQSNKSNTSEDLLSLKHIESVLNANGMTMADCGLQMIVDGLLQEDRGGSNEILDMNDECTYHEAIGYDLNEKQEEIVTNVLNAAKSSKNSGNRVFFVYGKAGCGKTYTFNALIQRLKSAGLTVIAVAATGIAATLLTEGRTAHSTFSLPLHRLRSDSVANVDASSEKAKKLRDVDVIIWDEISMQTRYAVECVDRLLRDVAAPDNRLQPFGGVVMVFGGDWCQFLPVVPGGSKVDIMNSTLKFSPLWDLMQVLVLNENMRLYPGEEEHAAWLRAVGEGRNSTAEGSVEIPAEMCMQSEEDVIKWMYTEEVLRCPQLMGKMALLTPRNCDAFELNEAVLKMTPGDLVELYGIDTPLSEEEGAIGMPCDDEEFLHDLTPSGMPHYRLRLKRGAIVMLLRNIDVKERLVNGTRLEVLDIFKDEHLLRCRNLLTDGCVLITRMPLDYEDANTGITFRRLQFPVRLSYCMTINKSQGQTFDKVGIIMRTPSFAHGSTYVALSRARSKTQVKVTINSRRPVNEPFAIRNIVYSEIIG